MPTASPRRRDALQTLSALLRTALDLTVDFLADTYLLRLLEVFTRFPAADRGPLLEKLESEVQARQRSMEKGDAVVGAPNPLGSLYVRVYENDRPLPGVTRDTLLRSAIQSTALMRSFPETVRLDVEEALLAGMATLEPADAEALWRRHQDIVALARWSERADGCAPI